MWHHKPPALMRCHHIAMFPASLSTLSTPLAAFTGLGCGVAGIAGGLSSHQGLGPEMPGNNTTGRWIPTGLPGDVTIDAQNAILLKRVDPMPDRFINEGTKTPDSSPSSFPLDQQDRRDRAGVAELERPSMTPGDWREEERSSC